MSIKITSGFLKNRNLPFTPKFLNHNRVRPTSNYTKQLIMNLIKNGNIISSQFTLENSTVADLCCGTGAMGFEFISNGAKKCYFIDSNEKIIKIIKNIATEYNIKDKTETMPSITNIRKLNDSLDLIFIDPPYQEQERIVSNFLNIAKKSDAVSEKTLILIEAFQDPTQFLIENECNVLLSKKSVSDTYILCCKIK
ncbi:RsmD family RNA methyltransferase [Candidatus Deianiraea vastatrix]|uniref:Ribosomal RNA small subunit methyltransferase D n=1 Tax=Candidatus Deianiraea vastatrix TaxID=2163644 RepID=A0A5B8XDS1_9RICK|nr:RsmD family RNA methyltransferase [Candidatus Deianiraea vastatrix]QED23156.1 Ribosomal RNA small subunit methyltransferase D [Candidatus Deianiraea vastatrix]